MEQTHIIFDHHVIHCTGALLVFSFQLDRLYNFSFHFTHISTSSLAARRPCDYSISRSHASTTAVRASIHFSCVRTEMMRFLNSFSSSAIADRWSLLLFFLIAAIMQWSKYRFHQSIWNISESKMNYEFNLIFNFSLTFRLFCFDSFQSSLILVTLFALSQAAPKPIFGGKEQ